MNRKPILWAVIVLAVGFVVFRTQRDRRQNNAQGSGRIEILERTVGGFIEHYTRPLPLVADMTSREDRIDWFAAAYADPSKPEFVLSFRNVIAPRDEWEAAAKKPIAMIADGNRHAMKPFQAVTSEDGKEVSMVSVGGPRSTLAAVVAAKAAEVEFGGKRYELSDVALANCRELLKRSEGGRQYAEMRTQGRSWTARREPLHPFRSAKSMRREVGTIICYAA